MKTGKVEILIEMRIREIGDGQSEKIVDKDEIYNSLLNFGRHFFFFFFFFSKSRTI